MNWIGDVGIRPESTRVSRGQRGTAPAHSGVVTGSVFLGDCVEVFVAPRSGEDIVAQVPRERAQRSSPASVHV